jgi:hypothetical protein
LLLRLVSKLSGRFSFHQAADAGGPGGGFNEDVDVGGTGGDNKMGENSGGIKFAHTS